MSGNKKKARAALAKHGFAFKDGKFYIFQSASIAVIRGWPKPDAWKKTCSRPNWVHFRPHIKLSREELIVDAQHPRKSRNPDKGMKQVFLLTDGYQMHLFRTAETEYLDQKAAAFGAFLRSIPEDIQKLISAFTHRQWHILSLLARCGPAAEDLIRNNPALAFALASNWVFHKPAVQRPLRSARALLCKKQREIAGWLGFPDTEAVRKILGKIHSSSVSAENLLYLRSLLRRPDADLRTLYHLPRINAGVLRIVTDRELAPLVSFGFLEQVSLDWIKDAEFGLAGRLMDVEHAARCLGRRDRLPVLKTVAQINRIHDELVDELNDRPYDDVLTWVPKELPPSPLPMPAYLVPIDSGDMLVEEGRQQQNCVASYGQRVLKGNLYLYRMLEPERATLAIRLHGDEWALSEIRGFHNQPVSEETERLVKAWLREVQNAKERASHRSRVA